MDTTERRTLWTVGATSLAVLAIIGYSALTSAPQRTTLQPPVSVSSSAAERAKEAAILAEANGDSEQALKGYQVALDAYKKDGNEVAAEDMSYKVEFMKQAIAADKKATRTAIENGDAVTASVEE